MTTKSNSHPQLRTWFAIAWSSLFPTLVTLTYFVWMANAAAAVQQQVFSLGKTIQFAFPIVWVLLVERRWPRWISPDRTGIVWGSILGLLIMAAMLLLYFGGLAQSPEFSVGSTAIREKVVSLDVGSPGRFLLLSLFYCIAHSAMEEYYFRWFVLGKCLNVMPVRFAIMWSALAFAAHHVIVLGSYFGYASGLTWFLSFSVAVGGVIWGWLYHNRGNLWGCWVSHLLVDAGIFTIGYHLLFPGS